MLTAEFIEGYNASEPDIDNPYIWSSDAWLAYLAGADFAKRGTSAPIRVWTAGGNEWRVEYTSHYGLKGVVRA
jgi:hypothetical protein